MNQNSTIQNVNQYLRDLLEKKSHTTQVLLQFKSISDLLPYLHILQKFKKMKRLSLHGNRIKDLPTDLSMLQQLQELDLTNNLLDQNMEMVIISLKTLPKLKRLLYQVKKQKQGKLMQQLKTLQFLNNTKVVRVKPPKQYVFQHANEHSLNQFQDIIMQHFDKLQQYQKKYLGQAIQIDAADLFRKQIRQISRQCLDKLQMNKDRATQSLQTIYLFHTKFQMFELLKVKCVNLCMDIYADLGKFLKNVLQQQDRLFKLTVQMTISLARIQLDQKQKQQQQRYNNQFQSQHSIVNKNANMQRQLKRMRKQKDQYITEISQLQTHNKKLTQALLKASKGDFPKTNLPLIQTFVDSPNKSKTIINNQTKISNITQTIKPKQVVSSIPSGYVSNGAKSLTLKQLKQTIQQIYQSKLKFDDKNYQGKLARQTMNQYLFTYLNQKYGLKSLTLEAASNIVAGIQQYSSKDNDVAVFGKILRNQVDQQFRYVQSQLKTTVHDLLKMHVKAKMPYKTQQQINQNLQKRLQGQVSYEQCQDLIKYLYNKSDSIMIMNKLQPMFQQRKPKQTNNIRRKTNDQSMSLNSRGRIQFTTFMQQVLSFQLKNHQKLLSPLVKIFKIKDKDNDGIINQQEFVGVIQSLSGEQAPSLIPTLLQIVDPYQTKAITFTQMVKLVANYPQDYPILTKYAQKMNANQENHNITYN